MPDEAAQCIRVGASTRKDCQSVACRNGIDFLVAGGDFDYAVGGPTAHDNPEWRDAACDTRHA